MSKFMMQLQNYTDNHDEDMAKIQHINSRTEISMSTLPRFKKQIKAAYTLNYLRLN